jgi:aspartate/methionine/tyrosine aminotransferase
MNLAPFALERWLSRWDGDQSVIDIAASGMEPRSAHDLFTVDHWLDLASVPLSYHDTRGSAELRTAIASTYPDASQQNVLVTTGAIEASFLLLMALIRPGDEVVVVDPGYQQFAEAARGLGAEIVPWPMQRGTYDVSGLDRLVTTRTRLIVANTPHNPTGAVLTVADYQRITGILDRTSAWVLIDEVSRWLDLPDAEPLAPPAWSLLPRCVSTGGLSKALGLPGLRVGWIVADEDVIRRCWDLRDYLSLAPSRLDDAVAIQALSSRERIMRWHRDVLTENLALLRSWSERNADLVAWIPPAGGVVSLLRYRVDLPSSTVADFLATRYRVLLAPGSTFGIEGSLRIGIGAPPPQFREGLHRAESGLIELEDRGGIRS